MIFTSQQHFFASIPGAPVWVDDIVTVSSLAGWPLSFPYVVCATSVADTFPDRYHWYLHQRSEDPEKQYLYAVLGEDSFSVAGATHSGYCTIRKTALGNSATASPYSEDEIWRLFDMTTLYVHDRVGARVQAIRPIKRLVGGEV